MEPQSWPPPADEWGSRTALASSNLSPTPPCNEKGRPPSLPTALRTDEGTLRFRSRVLYLISGLSSPASPERPLPATKVMFSPLRSQQLPLVHRSQLATWELEPAPRPALLGSWSILAQMMCFLKFASFANNEKSEAFT